MKMYPLTHIKYKAKSVNRNARVMNERMSAGHRAPPPTTCFKTLN